MIIIYIYIYIGELSWILWSKLGLHFPTHLLPTKLDPSSATWSFKGLNGWVHWGIYPPNFLFYFLYPILTFDFYISFLSFSLLSNYILVIILTYRLNILENKIPLYWYLHLHLHSYLEFWDITHCTSPTTPTTNTYW